MRPVLTLFVLALAATACGDDDDDGAEVTEPAATTATTVDGEAEVTEPAATTAPADDGNIIEVTDLGVQFEAPEGWTPVDPQAIGDITDTSVLTDLAESTGVSEEALTNTITDQVELFVFSGQSEGEIAPNINAIAVPIEDLPDAERIEADFQRLGATNLEIESADAGGNDAIVVRYQLQLGDERVAEGYGLFVDLGDEVVNITVTTLDRAEADEVGELVTSTVSALE